MGYSVSRGQQMLEIVHNQQQCLRAQVRDDLLLEIAATDRSPRLWASVTGTDSAVPTG